MVTAQHILHRNLHHPAHDVVWDVVNRYGVAVCVHGGGQAPDQVPIVVDRYDTRLEKHAFTHPFGAMLAVMNFTVGGILHKFPDLRVGIMEAGCGWLPFWLERLDEEYELMPDQAPILDRKPSEYFLSGRCFVGVESTESALPHVIGSGGRRHSVLLLGLLPLGLRFPPLGEAAGGPGRPQRRAQAEDPHRQPGPAVRYSGSVPAGL